MSVNVHTIVGRLGLDPDVRELSNGNKVATMNVATTEKYIKDGERKQVTDWHRVVCFRPYTVAYIEKFVKKGTLVYVSGRHKMDSYQNNKGEKVKTSEIIVTDFKILEKVKVNTEEETSYSEEKLPF